MPFVRVVNFRLQPGKAQEMIAHVRQDLETEEPVPGLLSLHGLQNVQDRDSGMLVSFFQTREAMDANTANLRADLAGLQESLAGLPVVAVYEVVIEKRAAESGS